VADWRDTLGDSYRDMTLSHLNYHYQAKLSNQPVSLNILTILVKVDFPAWRNNSLVQQHHNAPAYTVAYKTSVTVCVCALSSTLDL
jgi:hypothetical protein